MINKWLYSSGLKHCCSELKESLSVWYNLTKHLGMNGSELYAAAKQFFKENPQYQKYEFDIHFGYDVDGSTWRPGCADGCCQTKAIVHGIYVVPVDWDYVRNLAFRESKIAPLVNPTPRELAYGL